MNMKEMMLKAVGILLQNKKPKQKERKHAFMKTFGKMERPVRVPSRAERRNAARKDKALGCWRDGSKHLIDPRGMVVVPYPFHGMYHTKG